MHQLGLSSWWLKTGWWYPVSADSGATSRSIANDKTQYTGAHGVVWNTQGCVSSHSTCAVSCDLCTRCKFFPHISNPQPLFVYEVVKVFVNWFFCWCRTCWTEEQKGVIKIFCKYDPCQLFVIYWCWHWRVHIKGGSCFPWEWVNEWKTWSSVLTSERAFGNKEVALVIAWDQVSSGQAMFTWISLMCVSLRLVLFELCAVLSSAARKVNWFESKLGLSRSYQYCVCL